MPASGPLSAEARFTCAQPGDIAAVALWFDAPLADGVVLSSPSADPSNHWGQGVLPLPERLYVVAGEPLCLSVEIEDKPGGFRLDWRLRQAQGREVAA